MSKRRWEKEKKKRNLWGNHFWQEQWQCGCAYFVCVCVISDSLDVAGTQLDPITVYRLPMSSHFDKLLNPE